MMLGRFISENACGCKYQKRLKQTNEKEKQKKKKKFWVKKFPGKERFLVNLVAL